MPALGACAALLVASGLHGAHAGHIQSDATVMVQRDISTLAQQVDSARAAQLGQAVLELRDSADEAVKMMDEDIQKLGTEEEVNGIMSGLKEAANMDMAQKARLIKAWDVFEKKAQGAVVPDPNNLLKHAHAALLETGAMADLKAVARAGHNASRKVRGAVPLDSMVVGFTTSLAPWTNVMKTFALPLIRAKFDMFVNFYGPQADGARLCLVASTSIESTYDNPHSLSPKQPFGGVALVVGPVKWDNVPGWSFGAGGGYTNTRYLDAADFNWKWTLSHVPETVGFTYTINLVENLQEERGKIISVLQTEAGRTETQRRMETHGETFLAHTWCAPDWTNAPFVLEGEPPSMEPQPTSRPNPADEWNPEPEDDLQDETGRKVFGGGNSMP